MVKFFGRDIAVDKHNSISQVATLDEVTANKRLKFMQENKSTARCNLAFEVLQVVQGSMLLVKHPGIVFHLYIDLERIGRLNLQFNAQNFILIGNRLFDDKIITRGILLNDTRLMDGLNKEFGATVHDRSLFNVDVNQHIIDTHATQSSQDMLNGVNLHTALAEGRTASCINHIVDISLNNGLGFYINSTKANSGIYRSRIEGEGAALTRVEACPFNTDSFFERTLFILHKN